MPRTPICNFGRHTALALRRKPALPRYVAEIPAVSPAPPKVPPIPRKDRHPRTRLIQAIHAGVKEINDHDKITSMVKEHLDSYMSRISQPAGAYRTVIRLLLSRNCIPAVISVCERMDGFGIALLPRLEARIIISLALNTPDTEGELLETFGSALRGIVESEDFTHKDLWHILKIMSNHGFPAGSLLNTVNSFYNTHGLVKAVFDSRLYRRFLRRGAESNNVDAGLHSLAMMGYLPLGKTRRRRMNEIYAAFLSGIRDTPHPNHETIAAALKLMTEQGVQPNILVVNTLISLETRTNSLHRAFTIYRSIKNDRNLRPDDFTFASLFNILNRLYNPKRRGFRHGRPIVDDIPSPRTLYRDMLKALLWKRAELAFQPSTSLLNIALRSFIYKTDYLGALVALQCFTAFDVPVNVITYKIVLTHLMNRITHGVRTYRKIGDDTWADRFLSLPNSVVDATFLANLRLGPPLITQILEACKRREFRLDWPLYAHKWQSSFEDVPVEYSVPSMNSILGKTIISLDLPFDTVPLQRLLTKAILCEVDPMRKMGYGRAALSHISKMMEGVVAEMIPPTFNGRLKKLKRWRKRMEKQRKKLEEEKAKYEAFEGYTKRRQRRKAARAKEKEMAAKMVDEAEKEGRQGVEVSNAGVDELQKDERGETRVFELNVMVTDKMGIKISRAGKAEGEVAKVSKYSH